MLAAGEPFGHLRDLLLLGFDEGAEMLDRPPRVLGGDTGNSAVPARIAVRHWRWAMARDAYRRGGSW